MSTDTAIKLFGKTIAMSVCSEEGAEDYDKCLSRDKEQQSTNSEETEKDSPNAEEDRKERSKPQEKQPQLKKPDRILACPRCKSMETKFCYYNNYNINQPRHFCKNCQRYWTAGGTMRNVPVGAGRRRSKSSTNSQFHHLIVSDTAVKANVSSSSSSSRMLSFGSDAPICEHNSNLQWAPWPYPWAPPPAPTVYPGHTCWGYGAPWISPIVMTSSSSSFSSSASTPVSPLGKHLRETDVFSKEYKSDSSSGGGRKGNIWMPKTLRINDPEEAAKSSIWATMGFDNNDKSEKGLFEVFPNKSAELKTDNSSHLFNANPASLSRYANFQESS